jgi:hypothetical protein
MDCVDQPEATNQTSRLRKTGSGNPEAVSRDVRFEALMEKPLWVGRPRACELSNAEAVPVSEWRAVRETAPLLSPAIRHSLQLSAILVGGRQLQQLACKRRHL